LALVKDIEIIGEAAYRISPATRESLPDVPWKDIIGMRHRLVHAYFDINLDVLWRTVTDDRPPLSAELERVTSDQVGWSPSLSRRFGCAGDTCNRCAGTLRGLREQRQERYRLRRL